MSTIFKLRVKPQQCCQGDSSRDARERCLAGAPVPRTEPGELRCHAEGCLRRRHFGAEEILFFPHVQIRNVRVGSRRSAAAAARGNTSTAVASAAAEAGRAAHRPAPRRENPLQRPPPSARSPGGGCPHLLGAEAARTGVGGHRGPGAEAGRPQAGPVARGQGELPPPLPRGSLRGDKAPEDAAGSR